MRVGGVGVGTHTDAVDVIKGKKTSNFPSRNAIMHIQKVITRIETAICAKNIEHAMLKWHFSSGIIF